MLTSVLEATVGRHFCDVLNILGPPRLITGVRAMRATPPFRFFVPAVIGLFVGLVFALTLFLIPVSFSGTTIWNRVGEVYNQLHYPASRLAAAWRSAGLPPRREGAVGTCAIVAQWLLLGLFAGAIWLYAGRSREKSKP